MTHLAELNYKIVWTS